MKMDSWVVKWFTIRFDSAPFRVEDIEKQLNSEQFSHSKEEVINKNLSSMNDGFAPCRMVNIRFPPHPKNEFDKFRLLWWFIDGPEKHFHLFPDSRFICRGVHIICIKSQPNHLFLLCHISHLLPIDVNLLEVLRIYFDKYDRLFGTHEYFLNEMCGDKSTWLTRN